MPEVGGKRGFNKITADTSKCEPRNATDNPATAPDNTTTKHLCQLCAKQKEQELKQVVPSLQASSRTARHWTEGCAKNKAGKSLFSLKCLEKSHRATNWLHSGAHSSSVQKLTPTTHTPPVKQAQGKLTGEILVNGIVLNIPQV